MKRRRQRLAVWLCLLLQSALGVPAALGLTLCVAEDGHVAIELAHEDISCLRDAQRHHPDAERLGAAELAAHPCRDVSILGSSAYDARSAPHRPGLLAVAACSTLLPAQYAPPPLVAAIEQTRQRGAAATRLLRSVVLLV